MFENRDMMKIGVTWTTDKMEDGWVYVSHLVLIVLEVNREWHGTVLHLSQTAVDQSLILYHIKHKNHYTNHHHHINLHLKSKRYNLTVTPTFALSMFPPGFLLESIFIESRKGKNAGTIAKPGWHQIVAVPKNWMINKIWVLVKIQFWLKTYQKLWCTIWWKSSNIKHKKCSSL